MVERGRGTILLTGATAATKGSALLASLAMGKFGLRASRAVLSKRVFFTRNSRSTYYDRWYD